MQGGDKPVRDTLRRSFHAAGPLRQQARRLIHEIMAQPGRLRRSGRRLKTNEKSVATDLTNRLAHKNSDTLSGLLLDRRGPLNFRCRTHNHLASLLHRYIFVSDVGMSNGGCGSVPPVQMKGKRSVARRQPGLGSSMTAVPQTAAIRASTCRLAQQPLRASQGEYAWQHPPTALAAIRSIAKSKENLEPMSALGRSIRGSVNPPWA
jgi:hypothetical protein